MERVLTGQFLIINYFLVLSFYSSFFIIQVTLHLLLIRKSKIGQTHRLKMNLFLLTVNQPLKRHVKPVFIKKKKKKIVKSTLFPLSDERQTKVTNSLKKAQQYNFLWTSDLKFSSQSGDVPMQVGWDSNYDLWEERVKKRRYLKQINKSPTSTSVVTKILKRS